MVIYCEMHPIKTLEKLNYQRLTTEFTDVTVTVAGQQFSLHKSLLASYSSLFCSVFQEVAIGESAPNINLDGVGVEFFSIIIDFIYTSKLDATPTNIDQLLTAAQFLQMPEVIDLCNEYKKKDIEDVSQNNSKVEGFTQCEKQNTINSEVSCEEKIFFPVIPKDENGEVRKKQNLEQVANMMVEVYQSSDGSFAKEDESINKKSDRNYPGLVYTRAEIEEAKKTSRRGPRLQTRITCQVCNKSFTRQKYEVHKRTHTGEKPYQCTTCEKQFVSIYNLRVHERIHTGERPYRCNQCNKTFSDPSTVTKHMSMHEGVKNKKCDLCGKLFATLAKVREHRRTHTKEKPFVCPDCGKAYGYRCDLKRHMREHTGDLIGPCPDCGKCFNHKSNYLSHVKTHVRKSNAPQLKIQDSGLMISDGRMILKAKIDDGSLQGMLMMPEHESMSDNHGNATNVALQETIASGESEMGTEQIEKLSNSEDDGEIEVTINNGKLYVKHSNGAQSSTILDGSRIILKDENLSVDTTNSSSQCGTSFSADQVLMLVQHAQGIDMSSSSMQQSKDISLASENVHDQLMDREENTLVVVSEDI